MVWRVKERKEAKKQKSVSFADPIATELKAPKINIPDDSILLIKDQYTVMVEAKKQAVEPILTISPIISNAAKPVTGDTGEGHRKDTQDPSKDKTVELMLEQLHNYLHFDRLVERTTMEAIKVLIEEGTKMQKKGDNQKGAAGAPRLVA